MADTGNTPWYDTFDDVFWLTISGSFFAFLAVMLKACLKSRCTTISCFGLECTRDLSKDVDTSDIKLEMEPPVRSESEFSELQEGRN